MKRIKRYFYSIVFIVFSTLAYSLTASASYKICLQKEVSNDGVAWFDANTQAEAVVINDDVFFRFTVTKCPTNPGGLKDIVLEDPMLNLIVGLEDLPHSTTEYPVRIYSLDLPGYCAGDEGYKENVATVTARNFINTANVSASDNAWVYCENIQQGGGEGCTPGYWKQPQHADSWGVDINTTFLEVFGRSIEVKIKKQGAIYEPTLLEALDANGGQVNMAARHAAAAYLNAVSSVNYDMSETAIIEAFQNSFDDDNYGVLIQNLVDFNEQGCPLN
jgi:hypothetical protein